MPLSDVTNVMSSEFCTVGIDCDYTLRSLYYQPCDGRVPEAFTLFRIYSNNLLIVSYDSRPCRGWGAVLAKKTLAAE